MICGMLWFGGGDRAGGGFLFFLILWCFDGGGDG